MFLNSSNSSGWNICERLRAGAVSLSVCISRRLWLTFSFDCFCVFFFFLLPFLKAYAHAHVHAHARTDAEKQTAERSGQCYFVFWQTDKKREKRDLHRPVIRPVWQRREQRGWKISTRGELGEKERERGGREKEKRRGRKRCVDDMNNNVRGVSRRTPDNLQTWALSLWQAGLCGHFILPVHL